MSTTAWGSAVAEAAERTTQGGASARAAAHARWTRWAQEEAPAKADEAIAATPINTGRGTETGAYAWASSTLGHARGDAEQRVRAVIYAGARAHLGQARPAKTRANGPWAEAAQRRVGRWLRGAGTHCAWARTLAHTQRALGATRHTRVRLARVRVLLEVSEEAWERAGRTAEWLTGEVVARAPPALMEAPSEAWLAWAVNATRRGPEVSAAQAQAMLATWRWHHRVPPLAVVATLGPERTLASDGAWAGALRVEQRAEARRRRPADDAGRPGADALMALCAGEEQRVASEIEARARSHALGGALDALRARWRRDPQIEAARGEVTLRWAPVGTRGGRMGGGALQERAGQRRRCSGGRDTATRAWCWQCAPRPGPTR